MLKDFLRNGGFPVTHLNKALPAAPIFICIMVMAVGFSTYAQTVYESEYTKWMIRDNSSSIYDDYLSHKTNVDSIIQVLDVAIPTAEEYTGIELPKPVNAYICKDEGLSAWAGGGDVGYSMGCFKSSSAMFWVKGVVIGEYCNNMTGHVSGDWPVDWWADGVWYFPGFVAIETAKIAVNEEFALEWEEKERYPRYPVYNLYQALLAEFGWRFYQNLFDMVEDDEMAWGRIGSGNPNSLKTNYIIAYFSYVAGRDMSAEFDDADVNNVDADEVAAIINVRKGLKYAIAAGLNVSSVWSAFRSGDYEEAQRLLDAMNTGIISDQASGMHILNNASPKTMTVYSLSGRKLYSGAVMDLNTIMKKNVYGFRAVFVNYHYSDGVMKTKKVLINP